jgi:hypothetical protein
MSEAVIVGAVRTPVGRYNGALRDVRPDDLAALVIKELLERTGINPDDEGPPLETFVRVVGRGPACYLKPVKERAMSTADGQDPKKLAPHELRDKITDDGQHPEKLAPYEHRDNIMTMAEELAQSLVPDDLRRAEQAARRCDLMLAVGSTLSVYPIAGVVPVAKDAGARVVILNAQPTEMDALADVVLRGSISDLLPRIVAPRA